MGKPYTSLIEENESSEYDGGTSGQFNPHRQIQTANQRQRVGSNTCPKCDVTLKQEQECISCCVCELNFCIECT